MNPSKTSVITSSYDAVKIIHETILLASCALFLISRPRGHLLQIEHTYFPLNAIQSKWKNSS